MCCRRLWGLGKIGFGGSCLVTTVGFGCCVSDTAAGTASGMARNTFSMAVGTSYDAVSIDVAGSGVELGICEIFNVRSIHVVKHGVLVAGRWWAVVALHRWQRRVSIGGLVLLQQAWQVGWCGTLCSYSVCGWLV